MFYFFTIIYVEFVASFANRTKDAAKNSNNPDIRR